MAVFSRVKTWVSNEVLTAADLNAEFDNIIVNMAPTGIEDASANVAAMQTTVNPGGVGTESLPTDLAGEIQRLRYKIKQIIGGAQWYSTPVIDLGSTIDTADITNGAVTTAKIADGAVTKIKQPAASGLVRSTSSSGTFSTSSTSYTDVTNLTLSFTNVSGRPAIIGLIHDDSESTNASYVRWQSAAANDGNLAFLRGSSVISLSLLGGMRPADLGTTNSFWAGSSFFTVDTSSGAGTFTYKVQVKVNSGSATIDVVRLKLFAYEI